MDWTSGSDEVGFHGGWLTEIDPTECSPLATALHSNCSDTYDVEGTRKTGAARRPLPKIVTFTGMTTGALTPLPETLRSGESFQAEKAPRNYVRGDIR